MKSKSEKNQKQIKLKLNFSLIVYLKLPKTHFTLF